MRMDNETYRLKVEGLLDTLRRPFDPEGDEAAIAELRELALMSRKARYFLKALAAAEPAAQVYFLEYVLAHAKREETVADLERQIRHRFYEDRDQAKAVLSAVGDPAVLPALFRVIALTEEGWLAGELIRFVLRFEPAKLKGPLARALESKDYLLQCLAIYLIGKSGSETLLQLLAEFYKRPYGEKIDRLEKKAYDALVEGGRACSVELLDSWLRDKNARVRDLAVDIAAQRTPVELVADLVGLYLVDAKTRVKTAEALLSYEDVGGVSIAPDQDAFASVGKLFAGAKQEALEQTFQQLLRDESVAVRRVALKMLPFLTDAAPLATAARRVALEDHIPSVQSLALWVLSRIDREKLIAAVVHLLSEPGVAGDVVDTCKYMLDEVLSAAEVQAVTERIKAKQSRREAALDRFTGSVEWWRHDT